MISAANCSTTLQKLPGYADGMLARHDRASVRVHLAQCRECGEMLERYELLSSAMSNIEPVTPPPNLATRIRLEAARLRAQPSFLQRLRASAWLFYENFLQPLAVPATGGLLAAMLTFVMVTQSLVVGDPFGPVPGDLPLNFIQPARVESLAPFPVSDFALDKGSFIVIVEADVDSRGDVLSYQVLSGPDTLELHKQLDQVLMFSRFTPQLSFGRPTSGGRVMLSFSEVRVKG